MIEIAEVPEECRTKHLFLLIGTNPLPNYVAALLLASDSGKVHLLHSSDTLNIARALRGQIKVRLPAVECTLREIPNADSAEIRKRVREIVAGLGRNSAVGLHYTGGTKAMAVHVYRVLEQELPDVVCTYLDARTLSLRIDGREDEQTRWVAAGSKCLVTLNEVARLHGYPEFKKEVIRTPGQPQRTNLLESLAIVHASRERWAQWQAYVAEAKFQQLPCKETYPKLDLLITSFDNLCDGQASEDRVATSLGDYEKFVSYSKWLNGGWLEEYTLLQIHDLAEGLGLQDYGMNLIPFSGTRNKPLREFDLDVAAMRGYQLFAISCMVSERVDKCKEHLLEAYVRARQLGGDEARVALVCLYEEPERLEREIQEEWFMDDKVRVFGREHLPNLKDHLREWFLTANL
ncbi:MAG: hypothetical protein DCC55_28135 [Chloroflexi bacterium]|nr:MAG: hypothetical protein DCC55_28135 [Chloroflexota bacterium]